MSDDRSTPPCAPVPPVATYYSMDELMIRSIAREAAREAVEDTLVKLGFNLKDVREAQADMAAIRNWRVAQNKVAATIRTAAIWTVVTGAIGLIVVGIKHWLMP